MSEEKKDTNKGGAVILYGSMANGDPMDSKTAQGFKKLLSDPEAVKCLFGQTPEEYEAELHREIDEKLKSTKEEKEDED